MRGSPGENSRPQRVVEHFHDRERIANFMRDLRREQAQGGKFFVLTQLLLDIHHALVEPGFFDGDGRQFRQGGQDVDFLVGKTAGLAGINVERADGLPAENQRRAQQGNQPFAPGHVDVLIERGGLHVFQLHRLFAADDDAQETFVHAQARFVQIGWSRRRKLARKSSHSPGFIQHQQRAHARLHQRAGFAGDELQGFIDVEGGIDGSADADQRFQQPGLEAGLFEEPGVVNDLGRLHRQLLQQFLVALAERVLRCANPR